MPLPEDYLKYPHRSHGMDQTHYGWDPIDRREPVQLKDGVKSLGVIIIPLEFFPLNPPGEPFKHPGAMKTPYPDLRHYTTRDYGNRVGVYRILKALAEADVKATFAVNADVAERYPPLIDAIRKAGHEIAAHGVSTAHIHHEGLSAADEQTLVQKTREVFPEARTWMSPARNESTRTLDLIQQAGFEICLDWEADQRPIPMHTAGGEVWSIANYNELGDFKLLIDRSQSEDMWLRQITETASYHVARYNDEGASAFAFTMTPYVLGQPFRVHAVEQMLCELKAIAGFEFATAQNAVDRFKEEVS